MKSTTLLNTGEASRLLLPYLLDSDHLSVDMTLSSESTFLRHSVLTQGPLPLSRKQTLPFIQFLKDNVHSREALEP